MIDLLYILSTMGVNSSYSVPPTLEDWGVTLGAHLGVTILGATSELAYHNQIQVKHHINIVFIANDHCIMWKNQTEYV